MQGQHQMGNVTTDGPKAVVSDNKGHEANVVKASACWGNPQLEWQEKGVIDGGCSRHMTGNKSYFSDYEEIDGGFIAFGGNSKEGKITGKGKIRIGKLDFKDVYFVKELKFNIFIVSQMCDKKNSILFTDTECVVLSSDFKLTDENHVLLKVPRKDNMYSVDLRNVVPQGGLTCLFAKATLDESNLWHRRLGHINFKTINKLVRINLVRGLPSKIFENDHTCVAYQKGKQHKASYKTKTVSSISQPLQMLHMDLFGPTFVKSIMKKMYCLVVTDDFSRFSWVFFLATKDETSGILKAFITGIENQINHRVKIIRCDNGTEFKNKEMNQFCEMKNIKREFSVARTPQENRAEAVNTACYVQNMVLVIKPHNKTPYERFNGRPPIISFMRPFGCPVTILNTLDHLGKFDEKADEGFFVGYSVNSKAFRVFNSRTRIVKETLHITFLENKPNVAGSGPEWLFGIDALTKSMNYEPIVAGNQSNGIVGTKACENAGKARVETIPRKDYILLPFLTQDPPFSSSSKDSPDAGFKPLREEEKKDAEHLETKDSEVPNTEEPKVYQEQDESVNSTNNINTVSLTIKTASIDDNVFDENTVYGCADDPNMPNLEKIVYSEDDEGVGAEADMNNLDTFIPVSPIPTTKIHKDHLFEQIIRDLHLAPQTRRMTKSVTEHAQKGNPSIKRSKLDRSYARRALQFKLQQVWTLVDLPYDKRAIGTKWVYRNKKDERDIVIRNKARIEAIRLFLAYPSFNVFVVYQMDVKSVFLYGKIEEEVYVYQPPGFEDPEFPDRVYKVEKELYGLLIKPNYEILKKFGFSTVKTSSIPMKTSKSLMKDENAEDVDVHLYRSMIGSLMYLTSSRPDIMFDVCACARFQVTPKVSHLHAVKRIFRYLKGQPKLGLWYPKDSQFDLEAYTDSDYAGASLDRKSTTGGCQFLESRLISWQCKKQTVVANSTTEIRYVFASICCGQIYSKAFDVSHLICGLEMPKDGNGVKTSNFQKLMLLRPTTLVADETVHEERGDSMERAATTAASLDAEQDSGNIIRTQSLATLNEPIPQGTGSEAELEEEERVTIQRKEEANLISWDNTQAMMEADYELAQRLQAEEQGELTIEERSKLFVELMNKRKKHFAKLRAEEIRRKPPTKAQKRNQMSTYLRNMAGYKHTQLKNKSFKEIQMLFDKEMKRVNSFVPMDSEVVEGSGKKTESSRKEIVKIVPRDDEVVNVESLSTKYPIVDWKTHILTEDKIQDVLDLYRLVKERFKTTSPEGYDRYVFLSYLKVEFGWIMTFEDNLFELKNDVDEDLSNLAMCDLQTFGAQCAHLLSLKGVTLYNHYKEPTELEIQEMVNILVSGEAYDKVFNHLDMLHAPLEGKVLILTTAKSRDSFHNRRLINPRELFRAMNRDSQAFRAPSTSKTSALISFHEILMDSRRADAAGSLLPNLLNTPPSFRGRGRGKGDLFLLSLLKTLGCGDGFQEYLFSCLLLGSVRAVGVLDSE
ncbi:putative ribonuclease H-like domain-containing protein [Tanacetum coccineum]